MLSWIYWTGWDNHHRKDLLHACQLELDAQALNMCFTSYSARLQQHRSLCSWQTSESKKTPVGSHLIFFEVLCLRQNFLCSETIGALKKLEVRSETELFLLLATKCQTSKKKLSYTSRSVKVLDGSVVLQRNAKVHALSREVRDWWAMCCILIKSCLKILHQAAKQLHESLHFAHGWFPMYRSEDDLSILAHNQDKIITFKFKDEWQKFCCCFWDI